jgi:hypothetical protein
MLAAPAGTFFSNASQRRVLLRLLNKLEIFRVPL